MPAKSYRLKIVQDGREFEAEGDKAFVLEMLKRHGPLQASPADTTAAGKKGIVTKEVIRSTAGKMISIREFVQQLDLKKHTDITLAFGYYLEKQQGVSHFTPADINNCYYEAKIEPSNTSQSIIQNIKRSYFMESKKPGEKSKGGGKRYTLTGTGEKFIESKLPRTSA
jgi:hypothetical protein